MSIQVLLQGRFAGIESFLKTQPGSLDPDSAGANGEWLFLGKSAWAALITEVLPRALLAELGLARILLGTSGGGQFLLVLPAESLESATDFLERAAVDVKELTGGQVTLVWAATENLGSWTDVRARLQQGLRRALCTPAARSGPEFFQPLDTTSQPALEYFNELGKRLLESEIVGWSPEQPGRVLIGNGKHSWSISQSVSPDHIALVRHIACEDSGTPAPVQKLAQLARGRKLWGLLRGNVDNYSIRLQRAENIEEYLQLSLLYKQFFLAELAVLCSLPAFWRKVTVLYSSGDDFAVMGSWDVLVDLAREVHRLFHRFCEENLKELPGPEGRTLSMAVELASEIEEPVAEVFHRCSEALEIAKAEHKDGVYLLGQVLEWRQLLDAEELKNLLLRIAQESGDNSSFFLQLSSIFPRTGVVSSAAPASAPENETVEKPWLIHMRLRGLPIRLSEREFARLRSHLVQERPVGQAVQVKLRPAGQIAVRWARLSTEE